MADSNTGDDFQYLQGGLCESSGASASLNKREDFFHDLLVRIISDQVLRGVKHELNELIGLKKCIV